MVKPSEKTTRFRINGNYTDGTPFSADSSFWNGKVADLVHRIEACEHEEWDGETIDTRKTFTKKVASVEVIRVITESVAVYEKDEK